MKEIGFIQLTLMRWASYFFGLSLFGQIFAYFYPGDPVRSAFEIYIASFFFALVLPLIRARRQKRKVFIQDTPVTDK
ncbi:MAG: hypothetical protein ABI373_01295 [Flavobacteriales bacterium]